MISCLGTTQNSWQRIRLIPSETLTFVETTSAHAFYPRSFRVNKAGTMNAAAGQTSSSVAIIARYTTIGELGSLIAWSEIRAAGTYINEDGTSAVV